MRFTDWPAVLGLMVFALIAVACAAFMVATGTVNVLAVAGADAVLRKPFETKVLQQALQKLMSLEG